MQNDDRSAGYIVEQCFIEFMLNQGEQRFQIPINPPDVDKSTDSKFSTSEYDMITCAHIL